MRFVACSFPDDFGVVHAERARQEQQSIFRTGVAGMNVVLPFWGVVSPLLFLLWEFPPFLCVSLSLICLFFCFAVLGSLFFRFLRVFFLPFSSVFPSFSSDFLSPVSCLVVKQSQTPKTQVDTVAWRRIGENHDVRSRFRFGAPPTGKPPPRMNPSTASSETAA